MSIFYVALESFIDMNHERVLLSKQIDWEAVESEFTEYYCADNGRPSVPIRTMVGMMLLKSIYNLSDEGVVARWLENPYMQYFTGEKAVKRLGTIAKAMVNDIARKMSDIQLSCYREDIELYLRVIKQERSDKDKVYSLHEPEVECISKGKEHKKYEFGNKSAIAKTGTGLILSALAFRGNPYDGHTLSAHREQIARLTGYEPVEALTDRGYRGKKRVGNMAISIPSSGSPGQSYYQKRKARKKFCKRAGIEPVIGHLKSDHRMMRNYFKGTLGDAINTMMAAAAYNMRHWMNKHALSSFVSWLLTLVRRLENVLFENENQYAWKGSTLAMVAK